MIRLYLIWEIFAYTRVVMIFSNVFSRTYILLAFTFMYMIHFELIFIRVNVHFSSCNIQWFTFCWKHFPLKLLSHSQKSVEKRNIKSIVYIMYIMLYIILQLIYNTIIYDYVCNCMYYICIYMYMCIYRYTHICF